MGLSKIVNTIDLDDLERKLDLAPVDLSGKVSGASVPTLPTGCLSADLIMGGGFPVGRLSTISGKEMSGKSTLLYSTLRYLLFNEDGTPKKESSVFVGFFDYEGTMTVEYLANVIHVPLPTLKKVLKSAENFRYYKPDTGNEGLRLIQRVCKSLPRFRNVDGQWFQVYPKNLTKTKLSKLMESVEYDKTLSKKTGHVCVPVKEPFVQAVFFVDSWVSMLPEEVEDELDSNKPGVQASMFSKYLRGIKPMLGQRMVALIGVNQIREKPMVMFGSPEYEPGGNALQFYSDLRGRLNACSNPAASKKGRIEEETSLSGGKDRYQFSKLTTIKNKVFSPHRTTHLRIWFEADGKPAQGIDPVFDIMTYLKLTGQLTVRGDKYKFALTDDTCLLKDKALSYKEFKHLVLTASKDPVKAYLSLGIKHQKIHAALKKLGVVGSKGKKKEEAIVKAKKNKKLCRLIRSLLDLNMVCRKQIESGEAFDLYFENS